MKNKVKVPRFFYRDMQEGLMEIQNEAAEMGSVKEAMRKRLAPYAEQLGQEGADQLIEKIFFVTRTFCEAEAEIKAEDVRAKLIETVGGMTEEDACCYLSMLEAVFTAMDAGADENKEPMSSEEIKAMIENSMTASGELTTAERIDRMVEHLAGDSLKVFVYAGGNKQLLQAVQDAKEGNVDGAQVIADVLSDRFEAADQYAMTVCVCYEQILKGKIEGVTAENADPTMIALLISAGLSKGSIMKRLLRGEIDKELAMELLGYVETAIKWVLTAWLQAAEASVVMDLLLGILTFFGVTGTLGTILTGVGAVIAIGVAVYSYDEAEDLAEFLIKAAEFIVCIPYNLTKNIIKDVKERRSGGSKHRPADA